MTTLNDPTPDVGPGVPGVKFQTVGASLTMALVDLELYNQTDDDGEVRTFANGDTMTGTRIYGLVVKVDGTVYTGKKEDPQTPAVGDLVTLWIEGSKYFAWKDAKEDFDGKFETGDLIWYGLVDTAPGQKNGVRKIYQAKIAKNDGSGEFGEWKSKADAAHHGRKTTVVNDPTPTAAAAPTAPVEAPF